MSGPSGNAERRIRLTLHYQGAAFRGWQAQPDARTVQGEVERALVRLIGQRIPVVGAGRTDSGVHATGQVASVMVPERWTAAELRRALNAVLPRDVWVAEAAETDPAFHARYDAVARSYLYRVGLVDACFSPFERWRCWPQDEPLDREVLDRAAAAFLGEHAFGAFAKTGQPQRGERCTVQCSEWRSWDELGVTYHVRANRFLHHMVRYMVGTMVAAARGRRPVGDIAALLTGTASRTTSPPAPPAGLFLTRVHYRTGTESEDRQG
ncbi:MAG: tRNA pseudouridine(38-40) synthase TruA [Gemmatimonadota bacterium]